jgi:diadenosine tetraphosphate (Ap4A) HIT family hydrolase
MTCELCETPGGQLLWQDERLRVVYVDEPGYRGYCRVIWQAHVAEMTDLDAASRAHCMHVVYTVETLLRELLKPDKINLAALGNFTPHLHWHVIARFRDDPHFPQSIWGARQRDQHPAPAADAGLTRRITDPLSQGLAARLQG